MAEFVTGVKVFPNEGNETVVAGGSVTVADAVAIRFRLIRKRDGSGFFLGLPQSENKRFDETREEGDGNRKYFDQVWPISKEVRQALLDAVVVAYQNEVGGRGPITEAGNDDPPF